MTTETAAQVSLEVSETYDAPISAVYDAWSGSEQIKSWFGPGSCRVLEADFSPRMGADYHIKMDVGEEVAAIRGQFTEVIAEERLAFTFQWDGDDNQSLVTVTFSEDADGTQVTLTQVGLASEESKEKHIMGWTVAMTQLGEYVR